MEQPNIGALQLFNIVNVQKVDPKEDPCALLFVDLLINGKKEIMGNSPHKSIAQLHHEGGGRSDNGGSSCTIKSHMPNYATIRIYGKTKKLTCRLDGGKVQLLSWLGYGPRH